VTDHGRRLRLWSDPAYLPPGKPHVVALYPFWGTPPDRATHWPDFADRYVERAPEFLELTTLNEADLAVFPENWKSASKTDGADRLAELARRAGAAGAVPVVFVDGDSTEPVPVEGVTVFRTSMYRSRRHAGEYAQPGFHEDVLVHTGGRLLLRDKRDPPVVGFCGLAMAEVEPAGLPARARRLVGNARRGVQKRRGRPLPQDLFVRSEALAALDASPRVSTNVLLRETGGGGALYPAPDPDLWRQVRREYVDNMLSSDYVLCARGAGNWSWRLTETLSCGRIPVFVDTDCVLPYDFLLDWRELVVWVERWEVGRIGEIVADFHERLSATELAERQRACRRAWEDYLSPEGFFANLHLHFGSRAGGLAWPTVAGAQSGSAR
jgi:hypothetical protein